jgi:D-alanyl-D-alanine carboxypeptidase
MKQENYNRWLMHFEPMPEGCTTWIENASGYCYPVRSREVGRRLVAEWNRAAASERDKYELRGV